MMEREYLDFIIRFLTENLGAAAEARDALNDLGDAADPLEDKFDGAGAGAGRANLTMKDLALTVGKLAAAYLTLDAAYSFVTQAMGDALPYQAALAETSTLIDGTQADIDALSDTARSMAREFGTSAEDQVRGIYEALSAGVGNMEESIQFMDAANKLAIGGVTNQAAAVDILSTAVNSYSQSGLTAADASDALFVAILAGKTTADELASSLGQLVPISSAVGLSFDEAVAGVAALTTQGQSTSMAITGMRGILSAVIRPTSQAAEAAEAMGLEFNVAALQAKGLEGFLADVIDKTGGSSEALSRLFTDLEGLNAMLSFTGGGGEALTSTMEMMRNRAGATQEAFDKISDGLQQRLNIQLAAARDFALGVGIAMLNIVVPALEVAGATIGFVADNFDVIVAVMVGLSTIYIPTLVASLASLTSGWLVTRVAMALAAGTMTPMTAAMALMTGVQTALASATGLLTGAVTLLGRALTFMGGPVGIAVAVIAGLATYLIASREEARSLDDVFTDAADTAQDLSDVNSALARDYAELERQKRLLEQAERDGATAAQDAAIIAIEAVNDRIRANEALRADIAILKQQEILDAEEALRNAGEAYAEAVRNAFIDASLDQADINGDMFRSVHDIVRQFNELTNDGMDLTPAIDVLRGWVRATQQATDSSVKMQDGTVDAILAILEQVQQLEEDSEKVQVLRDRLEELLAAGQMAETGLRAAASGAGVLAVQAQVAAGAVQTLMSMIPEMNAAIQTAAQIQTAQDAYDVGLGALENELNARRLSIDQFAEQQAELAALRDRAIAEIDGSAEATRDAAEALADYTDDAYLGSLDARARAVETEARAYNEVRQGIIDTITAGADRDAALEQAAEAHGLRMQAIEARFTESDEGGGGGSGASGDDDPVGVLSSDVEALGRLAEVAGDYRRETQEMVSTLFMDADARQARADMMEFEQSLAEDGIELTEQEREALQRLIAERQAAVARGRELIPQLYRALDETVTGMSDASDVAQAVVSELSDSFDAMTEHLVTKGFSELGTLREMFGNAFKSMGMELINFAVRAMILQPILEKLKGTLTGMASGGGGGGGFWGFLSNIVGGIFGGGGNTPATATTQSAKGNVFNQSGVVPLMRFGESGEEALMPLERAPDGNLAVRALGAPGAGGGGIQIGTYAPSYHMTTNGETQGGGAVGSEEFMRALDDHMRSAFAAFLMEQQRNGGMLNPAANPYGN